MEGSMCIHGRYAAESCFACGRLAGTAYHVLVGADVYALPERRQGQRRDPEHEAQIVPPAFERRRVPLSTLIEAAKRRLGTHLAPVNPVLADDYWLERVERRPSWFAPLESTYRKSRGAREWFRALRASEFARSIPTWIEASKTWQPVVIAAKEVAPPLFTMHDVRRLVDRETKAHYPVWVESVWRLAAAREEFAKDLFRAQMRGSWEPPTSEEIRALREKGTWAGIQRTTEPQFKSHLPTDPRARLDAVIKEIWGRSCPRCSSSVAAVSHGSLGCPQEPRATLTSVGREITEQRRWPCKVSTDRTHTCVHAICQPAHEDEGTQPDWVRPQAGRVTTAEDGSRVYQRLDPDTMQPDGEPTEGRATLKSTPVPTPEALEDALVAADDATFSNAILGASRRRLARLLAERG